jgi:hypothetical protein
MPDSIDARSEMSVQAHLRLSLSYLSSLQSVAILVDQERANVPHLGDPKVFPEWVGRMCDIVFRHVKAVAAVLPSDCINLDAPFIED